MKKNIRIIVFSVLLFVISITGVKAETYDGEYSTEYLLRNYNLVTLGYNYDGSDIDGIGNIDFYEVSYYYGRDRRIEGDVLVNGSITGTGKFGDDSDSVISYVKGEISSNIITPANLVRDNNYVDFNKMYINIMNESKYLVNASKNHINSGKFEISSPGIYTVDNTAPLIKYPSNNYYYEGKYNALLIKNYDKNALYVFNYLNEFIDEGKLPVINIMERGSANSVSLLDYYNSGNYTGNIIFNFPNAREISVDYDYYYGLKDLTIERNDFKMLGFGADIIAPKAVVTFDENYFEYPNSNSPSYYFGSIIVNGVKFKCRNNNDSIIKKANYNISNKLIDTDVSSYLKVVKDNSDDYYSRDYSIKDLLKNYSLIALGKKNLDSKSKLLDFGSDSSLVKLFHITGQSLINGDVVFRNNDERTAFDLISNEVTESNINGKIGSVPNIVVQPWDNMANDRMGYVYQKNSLIVASPGNSDAWGEGNFTSIMSNYINYDRLYDNIVAEQSAIEEGTKVKKGEDNKIHLKIGGTYTIEDINDVNEIIFDNFDDNKEKLTIITVKNSGDVNFPLISKDSGGYKGIVTNDYYGKSEATHFYEQDTFTQDTYHGNIVWNLPNATYVTLKEGAPFAGHLIAPKADVETPETHFAGCFIVNSIYGEGNTEAHFYPLTVKACDCEAYNALPIRLKESADNYYLSKKLGGDSSIIETELMGDRGQYNDDISKFDNILTQCKIIDNNSSKGNSIVDILTNPLTGNNLILFVILGSIIGGSIVLIRKRKVKNN